MNQTLFLIPQAWLEGPILIVWLVLGLGVLAWLWKQHGWTAETFNFLPVYGVVAALLYFVAPKIGITDINPADPEGPEIKVGLAVRGYGMMMVAGIFAGAGLAMYRGRREGIHPERVTMLAFWMCICGVIGARLFYVIQKRDQFGDPNGGLSLESLGDLINMTQGGLVVYGALLGAPLGGAIYLMMARIPILKMADIVAPGMLVGLSLGRIGCLLNGCCFGGVCDIPQIALQFPAGSPPYVRQLETGELLGINAINGTGKEGLPEKPDPNIEMYAESINEDSLAAKAGVKSSNWFRIGFPPAKPIDKELRAIKQGGMDINSDISVQQGDNWLPIKLRDLPDHSLGVYPTQLIASINAAILALLLWIYFPFRRRHGQVFALLIILYSITRFLMELIRTDEYGQFGTGLTISQWVSVLLVLGGFALFAFAPVREEEVSAAS